MRIQQHEAVHLATDHDSGAIGRITRQVVDQRARGGDDLAWVKLEVQRRQTGDWRGKRLAANMRERARVEIEHGTFDERAAQVDCEVTHGWFKVKNSKLKIESDNTS